MKTYNIGFNGNDETQFDVNSMEELLETFANFCIENFKTVSVEYVHEVCQEVERNKCVDATFTSVWDGGLEITSPCKVNLESKEVFDISVANTVSSDGLDALEKEFITIDGQEFPVFQFTEHNNEFWYN